MSILKYFHKKTQRLLQNTHQVNNNKLTVNKVRMTGYKCCVTEVGTSSSILETPGNDSEDPRPGSPPFEGGEDDDECTTPSPKRSALDDASLTDVAQVVGSPNHSATKYSLLTNHFQASVDYKFPKGASKRSFQHQWLQSGLQ